MEKTTRKIISFGKFDYCGCGRRINEITVEMNLKYKDDGKIVFTASANVWNNLHTDIIAGGQCIDTIYKHIPSIWGNPLYIKIMELWKKHHLNDMHAGTPEQEHALKQAVQDGKLTRYGANNYDETCNYLKSIGLYEVTLPDGKMYKYGHGWLYEEIPVEDLKEIEKIMLEN